MKQRLKQFLSKRLKSRVSFPYRIPSAVLVPIYIHEDGQYHILFIKRTQKVRYHKGEISFPGGAFEAADGTLKHTALRECEEEIGLMPSDVELLGELDDSLTIGSSYIVTPFVGIIPWLYQFKLDSHEVEKIIDAPVSALLDKDCVQEKNETIEGMQVTTYFFRYEGNVIFGATARILKQFLDIFSSLNNQQ